MAVAARRRRMFPLVVSLAVLASAEQSSAWSSPVNGLRARLVEVDDEQSPFLAIEIENVGRASITLVHQVPMNIETAHWGASLAVAAGQDGWSFAGGGGPSSIRGTHELSSGKRERYRLGPDWERLGPRWQGPSPTLRFKASFSADVPSFLRRIPQLWTGQVDTPELVARFVKRP
jgi:hypothetical protein